MSFTDFNALQRDLAHILLSDEWLENVNIVCRDELLTPTALSRLPDETLAVEVLAYITPRNQADGRIGCGVIVEKPEFSVESPGVSGPQGNISVEFLVLEDRLTNNGPTEGTLRAANLVAQRILDLLHLHADDGVGTFQAVGSAITVARDFEPLDALRVRLRITAKRLQTTRCAVVRITFANDECTLTCATTDAQIYYCLSGQDQDGNWTEPGFPSPSNSAGGAQLYSAAFAVTSGQTVRACAFLTARNQSPVTRKTAP